MDIGRSLSRLLLCVCRCRMDRPDRWRGGQVGKRGLVRFGRVEFNNVEGNFSRTVMVLTLLEVTFVRNLFVVPMSGSVWVLRGGSWQRDVER
jgi:hypothetical protein